MKDLSWNADFDLTAYTETDVFPRQSHTVIVVPCYNEELRLTPKAFLSALAEQPNIEFLFVDDGSTDETLGLLKALRDTAGGRASVLALEKNGGKAEAVRQGLAHAATMNADYVGYWDADLATPLTAISDMVQVADKLAHVDIVFGSRRPLLGRRIRRDRNRRVVSMVCNIMARTALNMNIGDTQCGAKLLRNTPRLEKSLATPFKAGWLFDVELFARLTNNGVSRHDAFYELPLEEWTEIPGSAVSLKAVIRSGVQMLRLIVDNRLRPAQTPVS